MEPKKQYSQPRNNDNHLGLSNLRTVAFINNSELPFKNFTKQLNMLVIVKIYQYFFTNFLPQNSFLLS